MGFGDLQNTAGVQALNGYLADKSYIEGFVPSQADLVVFEALGKGPNLTDHALRWWKHIESYSADEEKAFPGSRKSVDQYGPQNQQQAKAPKKADSDDDLFGTDSESGEIGRTRLNSSHITISYAVFCLKKKK